MCKKIRKEMMRALLSSTADCGATSALACSESRNVKTPTVRKVKGWRKTAKSTSATPHKDGKGWTRNNTLHIIAKKRGNDPSVPCQKFITTVRRKREVEHYSLWQIKKFDCSFILCELACSGQKQKEIRKEKSNKNVYKTGILSVKPHH